MGKPINWGYVAGGIGNGLMQYMMARDQQQQREQDRTARNEEWDRRFQIQQEAMADNERRANDQWNERYGPMPLNEAIIGSISNMPGGPGAGAQGPHANPAAENMYGIQMTPQDQSALSRQIMAGMFKPQSDPYNPATDPKALHEQWLHDNGLGRYYEAPSGGPKPRSPELVQSTEIGNQVRATDYYRENYPLTPELNYLAGSGQDAEIQAAYLDEVSGGKTLPLAMQAIRDKLGSLPEGVMWGDHDNNEDTPNVLYRREDRAWQRDKNVPLEPRELEQVRASILSGFISPSQAQKNGPDSVPAQGPSTDTPGQRTFEIPLGSGRVGDVVKRNGQWVAIDRTSGDIYKVPPEVLANLGVN